MHVGVDSFVSAVTDPETEHLVGPQERIEHLLQEIALADSSGLYSFGIGEHHREEFYDSAPPVLLAAAAARTSRIRLGSAVTVLSAADPVRGLPAVRNAGPHRQGSHRPHRRTRLVHRSVPAVRAGPRRLRLALRRETRAATEDPRLDSCHLVRAPPPGTYRTGRLPAAGSGPAADLGRGRWHA